MTSYDRLDWHVDPAVEAGQPPENGFTHIGLYLAWLIRHDLHDPQAFRSGHVEALKRGEMTGSDLADDIDTKLGDFAMNAEGRAFSDARYRAYLDGYADLFADRPDYAVVEDSASYAAVAPMLDGMYSDWVRDGRPQPQPDDEPTFEEVDGEITFEVNPSLMDGPHVAPELEALIPAELTDPPMLLTSVAATSWGSSLLNRGLKRLGVARRDAVVVNATGGDGRKTLTVTIYSVPGVPADRLRGELEMLVPAAGAEQSQRIIGGRQVRWAEHPEFTFAEWARDGMLVGVAGDATTVAAAIDRLP